MKTFLGKAEKSTRPASDLLSKITLNYRSVACLAVESANCNPFKIIIIFASDNFLGMRAKDADGRGGVATTSPYAYIS